MRHALREPDGDTSPTPGDGAATALDQAGSGLGIDLATLRSQRVGPGAGVEAGQSQRVVEVWPELWLPLLLFQSLLSQFELHIGMGVVRWAAPRAVNVERHMEWLGIYGRRRRARVWETYRIFERKAVDHLTKRTNRNDFRD